MIFYDEHNGRGIPPNDPAEGSTEAVPEEMEPEEANGQ